MSEAPVTFDLSTGNRWGRAIYSNERINNKGQLSVSGCLTPLPTVGDTVKDHLGGIWRFAEVECWGNPPDGFNGFLERV